MEGSEIHIAIEDELRVFPIRLTPDEERLIAEYINIDTDDRRAIESR